MTTIDAHGNVHSSDSGRFQDKQNSRPIAALPGDAGSTSEPVAADIVTDRPELWATPDEHPTEGFWSPASARATFANTPVFRDAPRGQMVHIGNGIWRVRCRECAEHVDSYGAAPRYATIGHHEANEHELSVPGINAGLLA